MVSRVKSFVIGRSIRGRVGRFFLLVGLVPLLVMAGYLVFLQSGVFSETTNDNLANYARVEAASVEHVLGTAASDLMVVASNPVLRSPTASREEKAKQLREAQDFFNVFEDITLIDTTGSVIDSTTYSYYGTWTDKDFFKDALAGRPAASDPHLIPSPARLVVVFTAPVVSNGEVSAVVAGQMNMERVWEVLDSAHIGTTGFLVAVDKNGDIISHPNKDLLLTKLGGEEASSDSDTTSIHIPKTEETGSLVGQAAPVDVFGWRVVALQSSAEANALFNDALEKIFIVAAVVVALIIGVSLMLSKAIVHPISVLVAGMCKIADGNLDYRVPAAELQEIDDLSASFNTMAVNLEASTEKLKSANEELEKRYEELADARQLAATDSLTGICNHRSLQEMLAKEVERSVRYGSPLAILMMDVDGFKLFNETYGHHAGDNVLRQVAQVLMRTCRTADIVGRYGGDEFMVILPETDREGAASMANRILEELSQERVRTGSADDIPLELSTGVAVCPDDSKHKEELIVCAEGSLQEARQSSASSLLVAQPGPGKLVPYKDAALRLFETLVRAVDLKDRYTRRHSQQNAEFAVELGRAVGLSERAQSGLRIAGLLHDVGKIGVPDRILKKPGPLTDEEKAIMRQHVVLSTLMVQGVPNRQDMSDAVSCHHERWDGDGYPLGLAGADIPLLGRILAVVDAYSAMILDRPYRKALTHEEAVAELRRGTGTQFDPDLVELFISLLESRREAAA